MNVERFGEQRTIWKFTNDWKISRLHWLWKDFAKNALYENSEMIGWQVNCDVCGKIWRTTFNLKIHKWSDDKLIAMYVERCRKRRTVWKITNDRMISRLKWLWKYWWTTHNLKIRKWLDDKSIAMNVERFGEQGLIWKFTIDWMTS